MAKQQYPFEDFLKDVDPEVRDVISKIHEDLLANGCGFTIELAKNGYLVSYKFAKPKRALLNFVFRKSGLVVRIYGDFVQSYMDFLETLPEGMKKAIDKATVCKNLASMGSCNSRCSMGYDFSIGDTHYQKCKYNCFMFPVNDENLPFIKKFIAHELKARRAQIEE